VPDPIELPRAWAKRALGVGAAVLFKSVWPDGVAHAAYRKSLIRLAESPRVVTVVAEMGTDKLPYSEEYRRQQKPEDRRDNLETLNRLMHFVVAGANNPERTLFLRSDALKARESIERELERIGDHLDPANVYWQWVLRERLKTLPALDDPLGRPLLRHPPHTRGGMSRYEYEHAMGCLEDVKLYSGEIFRELRHAERVAKAFVGATLNFNFGRNEGRTAARQKRF
jgi:hypothetical protein